MKQEPFFRLLSIALLGVCALAIIPEVKPSNSEAVSETTVVIPAPENELEAVHDVQTINSGKFKPYLSGDVTQTYESSASDDSQVITN